jgi:hypothetical protein
MEMGRPLADRTVKQNVGPANLLGLQWCQTAVRTFAEATWACHYLGKIEKASTAGCVEAREC